MSGNIEVKRKTIPKKVRIKVYEKCNGHCAYCGCGLEYKNMQVDHVKSLRAGGEDKEHNMLPACRSCNHYKATLGLEEFRRYLSGISHRLMRDNIPFQVGIRFGLVKHQKDDVIFYFETLEDLTSLGQSFSKDIAVLNQLTDKELNDYVENWRGRKNKEEK